MTVIIFHYPPITFFHACLLLLRGAAFPRDRAWHVKFKYKLREAADREIVSYYTPLYSTTWRQTGGRSSVRRSSCISIMFPIGSTPERRKGFQYETFITRYRPTLSHSVTRQLPQARVFTGRFRPSKQLAAIKTVVAEAEDTLP